MRNGSSDCGITIETSGRFSGILKYPAALCGTLGISVLIAESVCSIRVRFIAAVILSVFWCTVFFLLLRPKKGTAAGSILLTAGLLTVSVILRKAEIGQGAVRFLASGAVSVWNLFMETIDRLGYVSLPTADSERFVVTDIAAIYFASFAAAAVFCLAIRKKTRLFAAASFSTLVITPLFIYNMPDGNAGISFLILAFSSLAAMRASEKHTGNIRASGYPGIAALLASAIIIAVPAVTVRTQYRDVGGLSGSIEYLRDIVTRIAEGDTTVFDGEFPNDYQFSHSVKAYGHRYTGREIMNVYSGTDAALYLRTWIGGDFTGTEWEPAQNVSLGNLTAEELTRRFVDKLNFNFAVSDIVLFPEEEITLQSLGIYMGDVLIVPKARTKYIPVPTSMLYGPFSENETDFVLDYTRVSDGVLVTKKNLSAKTPIYADVIIPAPRSSSERENFHRVLARNIAPEPTAPDVDPDGDDGQIIMPVFRVSLGALIRQHYLTSAFPLSIDTVLEDFLESSESAGQYFRLGGFIDSDEFMSSIFNSTLPGYTDDTDKSVDRDEWEYNSWLTVENGYRRLYKRIGTVDSIAADDIATEFADYLAENYKYNISPPTADTDDPVEEFLLNSKEGYCVQFATAMTLMMRRLGFPARYAEGYVANEFRPTKKGDYAYSCKVTDRKAHAWTEVWLDGFGWMVYEATPGFSYRGQNIGGDDTSDTSAAPETTRETQPPESTDTPVTRPPEQTADSENRNPDPPTTSGRSRTDPAGKDVGGILTAVLSAAAAAAVILLLARRSCEKRKKRDRIISAALNGKGNGETLCEMLFRMLDAYRICPGRNELPSAFENRAAEKFGDIARPALAAAGRQIYGDGMTDPDRRAAGAFLKYLSDGAKEKLGFLRFVWYRYIVCIL